MFLYLLVLLGMVADDVVNSNVANTRIEAGISGTQVNEEVVNVCLVMRFVFLPMPVPIGQHCCV